MRRRFLKNGKSFDFSNYMTFEVLADGFSFSVSRDVEYSCNGGEWKTLQEPAESPSFFKGDYISIKCVLEKREHFGTFYTNGRAFNLRGNALSLIFGDEISDNIEGYNNVLSVLFASCVGLKHVDKGFLPAKILSDGCYAGMFSNSTIETAPELPATTLAEGCYQDMFASCRALTTAPKKLPATTLKYSCYEQMFYGCDNLTTAPELPATILKTRCYYYMFYDCTKLNYIKMLATDISETKCLFYWVTNVATTGTFVKNPEATWDVVGDSGVPSGWTVKFDGEEEELTFPITLVEGDNGEIGRLLYQYICSKGESVVELSDTEVIYVTHHGITENISIFHYSDGSLGYIEAPLPSGWYIDLFENGYADLWD